VAEIDFFSLQNTIFNKISAFNFKKSPFQ